MFRRKRAEQGEAQGSVPRAEQPAQQQTPSQNCNRTSHDSGQNGSGRQPAQDNFGSCSHTTPNLPVGCEFHNRGVPQPSAISAGQKKIDNSLARSDRKSTDDGSLEIFLNFHGQEWLNRPLLFILVSFRR